MLLLITVEWFSMQHTQQAFLLILVTDSFEIAEKTLIRGHQGHQK